MVFPPYTYLILKIFTGRNKTPTLTRSTNMDIWVVGTLQEILILRLIKIKNKVSFKMYDVTTLLTCNYNIHIAQYLTK